MKKVLRSFLLFSFLFGCNPTTETGTDGNSADTTPPQWVSGFPTLVSSGSTSLSVQVKINESGNVYALAQNPILDPPTSAEVKSAYSGAVLPAVSIGSVAVNSGEVGNLNLGGLSPSTSFKIYLAISDSAGNLADQIQEIAATTTTSDTVPPLWTSGYPIAANIGGASVDMKVKTNETGSVWALAVPKNSTAPTSLQVKSQGAYSGVTPSALGSQVISANTEAVITLGGLSPSTDYDLYAVAADADGNLQVTPSDKITVTTLVVDTVAPSWSSTYPKSANITNTTIDLKLQVNESGTVYGILVADGATAPSSAQVKAGTSYSSVTVVKNFTQAVAAGTEASLSLTGLSAGTAYDLYLTAQDAVPNLMVSPAKLDLTTTSASDTTAPSWTSTFPKMLNIAPTSLSLQVSSSESGIAYYIAVASGAAPPTSAQVKAGTTYSGVTVLKAGSTALSASVQAQIDLIGLSETAEYDFYFAAEDGVPNLMAAPAKLSLLVTAVPTWEIDTTSLTTSQKITLETTTAGASISYTLDGTTPDGIVDGTIEKTYTGAVSGNGTLKAIAVKTGSKPSYVLNAGTFPLALGTHAPKTGSGSAVDKAGWASATYPLGSRFTSGAGSDGTFGLYSSKATKVILEIYGSAFGADAKWEYEMAKGSDSVWRAKVASLPDKTLYAFRLWGPNFTYNTGWTRAAGSLAGHLADADASANRFNPNKAVYDPYARELTHDDESLALKAYGLDGRVYAAGATLLSGATGSGAAYNGLAYRAIDTGKFVPKGVLFSDTTSFGTKPLIPKQDAMIYEAHVRALSKSASTGELTTILSGMSGFSGIENVPVAERGTYLGAAKMAKYLKGLGFNTIELLPVHECFNNEMNDSTANTNLIMGQENFWGYMTANFFAPERRYAYDQTPGGPTREFKQMVKAFHDAGIEVYLDVVYNHTGEGGTWGDGTTTKISSFRGIDNSAYYQLIAGAYQNDSGCGNNFAGASSTPARQLVLDSLTYWLDDMGVDGFRFDLAPVLGRDNFTTFWAFNGSATLLNAINSLGATKNAEMIAEAWDTGAYVLTQFPGNWSDWNGKFRDEIRGAIIGGAWGKIGDTMQGSTYYGYSGSFPESVNFVTAHDGLTMMDVVSYSGSGYASTQRTDANGSYYANNTNMALSWPFGPSDGGDGSGSQAGDLGTQAARRQALRNFWTITYFAKGIPMSLYGDEFGRTQNGNNNTYNVDSPATWSNYRQINTDSPNTAVMPETAATYHNNFGTDGKADSKNGLFSFVQNLLSIRASNSALRSMSTTFGNWASADAWASTGSFTIDGGANGTFWILVNMSGSDKTFTVPGGVGAGWKRIISTGAWAEANDNFWPLGTAWTCNQATYGAGSKEIVVFQK